MNLSHVVRMALTGTISASNVGEAVGSGLLMFTVLMVLGSPIVYQGWQNRRTYRTISSLPLRSPSTATDGEVAKISGQVANTDETSISPVQSERCELAFWKVSQFRRYNMFNHKSYWSEEGLGIDAESVAISGESEDIEIRISSVATQKTLDATDKLKTALGSKQDSVLRSVPVELERSGFEDKRLPSEEWPREYEELGVRVGFNSDPASSRGVVGRLMDRIRTPEGTARFQETTVKAGDPVTVVGRIVGTRNDCVELRSGESVDPLVTRTPTSELGKKYRSAYLKQLYGVPLFVTALCVLLGYGVFL